MINAGVGMSTDSDSFNAGKQAAVAALSDITGKPKMAILGVDSLTRRKYNYEEVLKGVISEIGRNIPLIGSTVNGIVVNNKVALRSVGLMLIGGDINVDKQFSYLRSRTEYENIAQKIFNIKSSIKENENQITILFQDGMKFPPKMIARQKSLNSRMVSMMSRLVTFFFKKTLRDYAEKGLGTPTCQELVNEMYNLGWKGPIIGSVASNIRDYDSVEFHNDKMLEDAVVGLIISGQGDSKFGHGYAAGAEAIGKDCKITKNVGSFLLGIDNQPAVEGFCNALNLEMDSLHELRNQSYLNFYNILGTREKVGDRTYTHLTATITDPALKNMIISGYPFSKVPKDVELFKSSPKLLEQTVKDAIMEARKGIKEPRFLLGIDCAIRMFAYGDNFPNIIKIYEESIGKDVPRLILGSGGEIYGTKKDDLYFNNMTFLTFVGGN